MRISDAQTRGPWRKKWVEYCRSLDLEIILQDGEEDASLEDQFKFFQARLLQQEVSLKILREIRRALTVGAEDGEEDPESVPPSPTDLKLLSPRVLPGSVFVPPPPPPESGE